MRSLDIAPMNRFTVGFDHPLNEMLRRVGSLDTIQNNYPPYNIERTGENEYRISLAVAGFSPDELDIEYKENTLHISAKREEGADEGKTFLHRGIAKRAFDRSFVLEQHVRVVGAKHEFGMLHVELVREVPEALKPRRIEIQTEPVNGAAAA